MLPYIDEAYSFKFFFHTGGLGISDLCKVLKATLEARTKWYYIGLELGIDPGTLGAIKTDNDDSMDRLSAMLDAWLKMAQPKPTLTALAALQSPTVGYGHLAEQILSLK